MRKDWTARGDWRPKKRFNMRGLPSGFPGLNAAKKVGDSRVVERIRTRHRSAVKQIRKRLLEVDPPILQCIRNTWHTRFEVARMSKFGCS